MAKWEGLNEGHSHVQNVELVLNEPTPPHYATIGTLDPIGYGHSIASNILAASGNPVLSCKHSHSS